MTKGYTFNRPTALTCPDCGGAVSAERIGTLLQYRCHIGHVLTAETMLVATQHELERALASCLAALNERIELCRQVAQTGAADARHRDVLEAAATQAREQAETIRALLQSEWVQPVHFAEQVES